MAASARRQCSAKGSHGASSSCGTSFAEHSRRALAACYAARGLDADAAADVEMLLGSLPEWPLWPDVAGALPEIAGTHRVGVLSNVDDELFRRTRAAGLVDDDAVLTSERLRAYKPHPELYLRARDAGAQVHVPASARDTRGALEAGLAVVRVRRPGHRVDPEGPQPEHEVGNLGELPAVLDRLVAAT